MLPEPIPNRGPDEEPDSSPGATGDPYENTDPGATGDPYENTDPGANSDLDGNGGPRNGNSHRNGGPDGNGRPGNGEPGNGRPGNGPDRPGATAPNSSTVPARPDPGPSLAAQITITVPLATLDGGPAPGEAGGFGLLDADDARALVAAAARHPDTRWCLTALHPDGTAAAHACAAGRHGWSVGQQAPEYLRALNLTLIPIIRGPCDHSQAEPRYRPSRSLRHLVNARNTRCTAPGCGRPAGRCDQDHTTPWHRRGLTCPCNISPLCKR